MIVLHVAVLLRQKISCSRRQVVVLPVVVQNIPQTTRTRIENNTGIGSVKLVYIA